MTQALPTDQFFNEAPRLKSGENLISKLSRSPWHAMALLLTYFKSFKVIMKAIQEQVKDPFGNKATLNTS